MQNTEYSLPLGTVLKSKNLSYVIVEVLGAGGFGITYKVRSTIMVNNVPITTFFAIKEHFMRGCYRAEDLCTVLCAPTMKQEVEESRKDFLIEAQRLNKLSGLSQNIVRVNEVFEYFGTAYYVMQYLDGGELSKHVDKEGPLSEAKALMVIRQIAGAVKLLHAEHLLHLDIKPDNIVLMTSPIDGTQYPVLIDFGIAKHFSSTGKPTSLHSAKGASDGYAPMEQYTSIDSFSPQLDVYALGATLFYLLTGSTPEKSFDIRTEDIMTKLPNYVSTRTKDAIVKAMQPLKENRTPDVQLFLDMLEQEYALPIGFVLRSPCCNYRIVGVEKENFSYIVYRAVVDEEADNEELISEVRQQEEAEMARQQQPSDIQDSDNEVTVVMEGDSKQEVDGRNLQQSSGGIEESEYNSTKVINPSANSPQQQALIQRAKKRQQQERGKQQGPAQFMLYELFDRKESKREENGMVQGASQTAQKEFEQAKMTVQPNLWEQPNEKGIPMAEAFLNNGTSYFTCQIGAVPPQMMYNQPPKQKGKNKTMTWLLAALVGLVVAVGAFFGVKYFMDKSGGKNENDEKYKEKLDLAIKNGDINSLKVFADNDSARAILPLAQAYLEKGDTANAHKYVNLAFDGKHELDTAKADSILNAILDYEADGNESVLPKDKEENNVADNVPEVKPTDNNNVPSSPSRPSNNSQTNTNNRQNNSNTGNNNGRNNVRPQGNSNTSTSRPQGAYGSSTSRPQGNSSTSRPGSGYSSGSNSSGYGNGGYSSGGTGSSSRPQQQSRPNNFSSGHSGSSGSSGHSGSSGTSSGSEFSSGSSN